MDFTTTIEIASDARTIWEALSNPQNWPNWMPEVKDVEPTKPGTTPGYGAEYTVKQPWWKLDTQQIQIRDFEPERRLAYAASTSSGEIAFEYAMRELADRRFTVDFTMRSVGGYAKLTAALSGGAMERRLVKEAEELRDYCEARSPQDVVG